VKSFGLLHLRSSAVVCLSIILLWPAPARAQFATKTGDTAATAGVACTSSTQGFAWPDANGYVLHCVSNIWTAITQATSAAGSTGYVQYNNGGALAGSANLFWNNGSSELGIGTATPANTLDVNGAMAVGTYAGTAAPSNGLIVSGQVGIGSTTPVANLDLNGSLSLGSAFGTTMTTLNGTINAAVTIITVVSTANYPSSGAISMSGSTEVMTYTGKTNTTFTGVTRGAYGTTASSHTTGATVYSMLFQVQPGSTSGLYTSSMTVFGTGAMIIGTPQFPYSTGQALAIGASVSLGSSAVSGGALAIGNNAVASGQSSVAIGTSVTASAQNSFAFGSNTTSSAFAEYVIGQYNKATGSEHTTWITTDPEFVIGDGTTGALANALMIFKNGQMLVNGGTTVALPAGAASLNAMGTTTDNSAASLNATNSSGVSLLYVRDDGHVGIGSTSPANALDVTGAVAIGSYAGTVAPSNGLIASGNVGIGTATPQSTLHVSGGEAQVGSGGGSCTANNAGAIRYTSGALQYCNGSSWTMTNTVSNIGAVGYFVLSKTTYDGNRGGMSGANANCLTELTTNTGWKGYSTALASGQLVAGNVFAFVCDTTTTHECNILHPSSTYTFANANDGTAGGATFATDAQGYGPGDSANWSGLTYFNTAATYWTGFSAVSATTINYSPSTNQCTGWSTNSSGTLGLTAISNSTTSTRWANGGGNLGCNLAENLVCIVNPQQAVFNQGADVGWFVLLGSQHTGALGGLSGANSTCLTALQAGGWSGYNAANANGQLTSAKVFAFLCDGTTCQNLNANTTYYYACGLDSTAGGGSFTTDGSGLGPNNSSFWEEANAFGYCHNTSNVGSSSFWTGRASTSNTQWANSSDANNCTAWTTSSAGVNGQLGGSAGTTSTRWTNASATCLNGLSLVCYVNP
jgi:hypothetical protein